METWLIWSSIKLMKSEVTFRCGFILQYWINIPCLTKVVSIPIPFHVEMQVHMCNKLASRHVRVGLADPNKLVRCDICENSPGMLFESWIPYFTISRLINLSFAWVHIVCLVNVAFFYCEIDGTSLCLSCDMTVHVGGKRTHGRYLLLRQRVEVSFYSFIDLDCYSLHFYSSQNRKLWLVSRR